MRRTTVFMTGATGNMGWAGFQELYKRKDRFRIVVLARPSQKNRELLAPYLRDIAVKVVWGDMMNYEDVLKGVSGADVVLHIGGMVSPQADYFPEKTLKVNLVSSENVVRAVLAQRNSNEIKTVFISSVAHCGDRLQPLQWGRTGDPVYPSSYDAYSASKYLAEKIFSDSGLGKWVCLRQSGILYPGILKNIDPILFHVPMRGVLEWTTIEDSGRLLANICENNVPDEFWNRFYNIGSGEEYRLTNYEFYGRIFRKLCHSQIEKVADPKWFALQNFHGMWFADSDLLESYLHFRGNVPFTEYFESMLSKCPKYYTMLRFVPDFAIRLFLRHLAGTKGLGPRTWLKDNPEMLKAAFGSESEYEKIEFWKQIRPSGMLRNLEKASAAGEVRILDHGYDTSRSIYSLSVGDLERAAEFRGGHFLGPADLTGEPGTVYLWECEHGHKFKASIEFVLLGGGWCDCCNMKDMRSSVTPENRFIWQILSGLYRE